MDALTLEFPGFPSPESNFVPMPLDLIAALPIFETLAEIKVVMYILRHTWGYREYEEGKRITLDEFENGRKRKDGSRIDPGIGMAPNSIRDGVDRAVKHGFIYVEVDDKDKARIEKFYSLRMFKDCTPGVQLLHPGVPTSDPRTEIDTKDKDSKIEESSEPATQVATPIPETENSNPAIQEKALENPPPKVPLKGFPLPPLAPPGFRWLCSSVSDSPMCLIPTASNDRTARPLCKRSVPHRVAWSPLVDKPPCAECVRIAMEPPKLPNETWSTEVKNEFADLCKMNWIIPSNATMMSKYLRDINCAEPITVEKLQRFRTNWYKCDFRGKQGSAPKARWVSEHWTEYTESDDCREESFNGTADAQQASRGANSTAAASNNGREPGLLADGEKLTQNQRFAILSAQQAERERSRR